MDLGDGHRLSGLGTINVILGKNGSGKSTLLRLMDKSLSRNASCIRYITPERGGELIYDGSIDTNRSNNPNWLENSRRKNQWNQFKQSSVSEFRNLETLVLRSIEQDPQIRSSAFSFDDDIAKINLLLDRVTLNRSDLSGFDLKHKSNDLPATAQELSSGESELVSLGTEILGFAYLCKTPKYSSEDNWLLLDEPDVHLHPDLQYRLMKLLVDCVTNTNAKVAVATHSTTILASLVTFSDDLRIGFKQLDSKELVFQPAGRVWKDILPIFGAHPLSNIFNERPPLIVEGEDDQRIWQTAVRHSEGRVSVIPCVAGDVQSMTEYENTTNDLLLTIYDHAKAFSLRDGDGIPEQLTDLTAVVRCRLNCRTAENLILTDDVLRELGVEWAILRTRLEKWIQENRGHPQYADAAKFRDDGWDRREGRVKSLRNVIVGVAGSTKPWEVAVGRAIANLDKLRGTSEHSLTTYLDEKLIMKLDLAGTREASGRG